MPWSCGAFLSDHAGLAVVKTPRGGYDGKGVRIVRDASEAADDWFAAAGEARLLAEELVPFRRELAQLVARRPSGELAAWPLVETVQRGRCLRGGACAPAPRLGRLVARGARAIAEHIATRSRSRACWRWSCSRPPTARLLVNELAMRPHNTGHWSIDGAVTSQFEQHLRAVLDLPLGDPVADRAGERDGQHPRRTRRRAMPERYQAAMADRPEVKLHSYGKASRPGRKVGHVTAVGDELDEVVARARAAAAFFQG